MYADSWHICEAVLGVPLLLMVACSRPPTRQASVSHWSWLSSLVVSLFSVVIFSSPVSVVCEYVSWDFYSASPSTVAASAVLCGYTGCLGC